MIFKSSLVRQVMVGVTLTGSVLLTQTAFAFADDDARRAIVEKNNINKMA